MKKIIPIMIQSCLIILTLWLCQACNKEVDSNNPPDCDIVSPIDGAEYAQGEIVKILVDAKDSDGSVSEVSFSVNGTLKDTHSNAPWEFDWNTNQEFIGKHIIRATSQDNDGSTASDEITITLINGNLPVAEFTADQTRGEIPLTVHFTDQTTKDPTGWSWDFGDGSSSNDPDPVHEYNTTGVYSVTLVVQNDEGYDTIVKKNLIKAIEVIVDLRDNQSYETIRIGEQTWFAENLNYETVNSWWFKDEEANGEIYGRLYTWSAATNACPDGWHLPSDDEWKSFEMFLGMSAEEADKYGEYTRGTDEGQRLKCTTGWLELKPGTDEVGFAALPGGERNIYEVFAYVGSVGTWWTGTEFDQWSFSRTLDANETYILRFGSNRLTGKSVRCIKN